MIGRNGVYDQRNGKWASPDRRSTPGTAPRQPISIGAEKLAAVIAALDAGATTGAV